MRLSNSALTASRSSSSRARDGMVAVCVELLFYRAVLCSAVQPQQMPPSVHLRRACPDVLVRQQSQVQSWYRARAESSGSSLLVHSRGAGQHQNSKFKSERTGRTVPPAYSGNTKWDTNQIKKNKIKDTRHKQVVITRNGHPPATTPEASQWGYSQCPRQDYPGTLSHGFSWSPRHSTSPHGVSLSSPNA